MKIALTFWKLINAKKGSESPLSNLSIYANFEIWFAITLDIYEFEANLIIDHFNCQET